MQKAIWADYISSMRPEFITEIAGYLAKLPVLKNLQHILSFMARLNLHENYINRRRISKKIDPTEPR